MRAKDPGAGRTLPIYKETKSSFAIEGEVPSAKRTERFVAALTRAAKFDTSDPQAFIRLQNDIVDPRYAATGWRTVQSFIGETMSDFREHVHFVFSQSPRISLI